MFMDFVTFLSLYFFPVSIFLILILLFIPFESWLQLYMTYLLLNGECFTIVYFKFCSAVILVHQITFLSQIVVRIVKGICRRGYRFWYRTLSENKHMFWSGLHQEFIKNICSNRVILCIGSCCMSFVLLCAAVIDYLKMKIKKKINKKPHILERPHQHSASVQGRSFHKCFF